MQTTAIGTVANSLPENEVILLTILISDGYIPYTELRNYTFTAKRYFGFLHIRAVGEQRRALLRRCQRRQVLRQEKQVLR